jgi:hypothetical protein
MDEPHCARGAKEPEGQDSTGFSKASVDSQHKTISILGTLRLQAPV